MEEEFKLVEKRYVRESYLFKKGNIAEIEFENSKGIYLQKKNALEGMHNKLLDVKSQIVQFEDSIQELELLHLQQNNQLLGDLKNSYENLQHQITQWIFTYVLASPIDGVVSFAKFWTMNQTVKAGEQVFSVFPDESTGVIGIVILPLEGSGKVKPRQKVNVKFFNYPHTEFGIVEGIVKSKSPLSTDSAYSVEINFPDGLKTNYGKNLEFSQQMEGTCEILTEDIRLFWRIFSSIKSLIKARS